VWDIFEQTTSEVVNDEGGELWTCNIAYDIPMRHSPDVRSDIVQRGRRMTSQRSAQFNTVLHCLQTLQRIGYHVPDFSYFKMQALREHNLDVVQVNESIARVNQMDVVSYACYHSHVY
jgi:hypothetical protein